MNYYSNQANIVGVTTKSQSKPKSRAEQSKEKKESRILPHHTDLIGGVECNREEKDIRKVDMTSFNV